MKYLTSLGILGLVLIVVLGGFSSADESPAILAYIQGGASSVTEDQNGSMLLTIPDLVPYYHLSLMEKSLLMPIEALALQFVPVNAALVFNSPEGESVSLVEISDISVSDMNNTLKLQVKNLESYEGKALSGFTCSGTTLTEQTANSTGTGIYLEIPGSTPENFASNMSRNPDKTNPFCILNPDSC